MLDPQRGVIAIGKEEENLKPMEHTCLALSLQARIHGRKYQTLGVPRQSGGFTYLQMNKDGVPIAEMQRIPDIKGYKTSWLIRSGKRSLTEMPSLSWLVW